MKALARQLAALPGEVVMLAVRAYQLLISPWFGPVCRYDPSCSNYMLQAVRKYGVLRGTAKGIARICRCHPFRPGGFDPP